MSFQAAADSPTCDDQGGPLGYASYAAREKAAKNGFIWGLRRMAVYGMTWMPVNPAAS
jgi:hypothetical protein